MKKYLIFILTSFVLISCSTTTENVEIITEEENRGSVHAENSYFVIDEQAVYDKLDTVEFKMLINLEDYEPEVLWNLLKEAAAENNVAVEEEDEP